MFRKNSVKVIISITVIFVLIGLVLLVTIPSAKQSAFEYVQNNCADLESFATELIADSDKDISTTYMRWDVSYWHDTNSVEFITHNKGIVPNSVICGFYYSPENIPLGFQGFQMKFDEYGSGWKWIDAESDNWEYTERIIDNWFWFEVNF